MSASVSLHIAAADARTSNDRLAQALSVRILSDRDQDFSDSPLNAGQIHASHFGLDRLCGGLTSRQVPGI